MMKRIFAVIGVVMIGYVIASASAVSAPGAQEESGVSDAQAAEGYLMREENNRVVVYRDGALWLKTDTQVSDLPKRDRVKLRRGIAVNSESELKQLIEDYCS